jgi:hypothetical protein
MPPIVGKIKPPKSGLTAEAAEALASQEMTDPIVIVSEVDESPNPFLVDPGPPLFDEFETGDGIDDSKLRQRPEPTPEPRDAKPGVPSLDEWLDFFSRIVLRVGADWYIEWAFRGVDENTLTDRELDRLQMSEEERKRIAVPFAELSHKSKIMRKHGRTIVASGGAFDAIIAIGRWTSRVNRIARRHKPQTVKGRVIHNDGSGQNAAAANGFAEGANGGHVGGGWTIVNPGG